MAAWNAMQTAIKDRGVLQMSDNVLQLASRAFPQRLATMGMSLPLPLPSFKLPAVAPVGRLPHGRVVEISSRGSTYVLDSGPAAGGPTFVLLHSLACTWLLTWYPSLEMMRRFGRVVVFDQRWHGSGIASPRFLLEDCADDVAALADELGVEHSSRWGFRWDHWWRSRCGGGTETGSTH